MIRIGAVNIDTIHPKYFASYLAQGQRARYVAVYNGGFRGDDEVEGFMRTYGLERRCQSIDELADYVDIGFIHSCNWDNHLQQALPFIERGKPVFIDTPLVGNLADCRQLEELVANGAVVLGCSSLRYAEEIISFTTQPREIRGKTLSIHGTVGIDSFSYGMHIIEAIGGLTGKGAVSAEYVGRGQRDGRVCETYFVRFANGITATYNTFYGAWQPFEMIVMTTTSTFHLHLTCQELHGALLDKICDFMEGNARKLASVTALTESVKIALAARISREQGGDEVFLFNIPADDPGYRGELFERQYAAKAEKIYLS